MCAQKVPNGPDVELTDVHMFLEGFEQSGAVLELAAGVGKV